ncbi:MAG: TOBE domain-containing protein, partial [Geodermatophilaceae bacterium]
EAAAVLGVSDDTIRRWIEGGRLELSQPRTGPARIEGKALAALAVELSSAPDPAAPRRESARNRMAGIVTRVVRDTVMAQVDMQCGPYRLVSLMSREAADELGLEPGSRAIAAVKATNVIVEVP